MNAVSTDVDFPEGDGTGSEFKITAKQYQSLLALIQQPTSSAGPSQVHLASVNQTSSFSGPQGNPHVDQ